MKYSHLIYDRIIENYEYFAENIGERFTLGTFVGFLIKHSYSEFLFEIENMENIENLRLSVKKSVSYYFDFDVDIKFKDNTLITNIYLEKDEIIDLKKIKRQQKLKKIK